MTDCEMTYHPLSLWNNIISCRDTNQHGDTKNNKNSYVCVNKTAEEYICFYEHEDQQRGLL